MAFVWKHDIASRERKKSELFDVLSLLDTAKALASNLAAIYRLRDCP